MSDLPKRLRIKASMIALGERVAWGSDTALMEEAADVIEALSASVENHQLHMLGMARDRDQLRALLTAQPQASAEIPFGGFDPNFCPGSNPDNPQTEEHEPEQPGAAQSAPAGEREAFELAMDEQSHKEYRAAALAKAFDFHVPTEVWRAGYIAGIHRERAAWQRAQSAGVPEGWRLVPVEPTLEMVAALGFNGDIDLAIGHGAIGEEVIEKYTEMLAAAPAQPAAQGEFGDAYQGAREDLAIWKRRALEAEEKVRNQEQIIDHLTLEAQGESRMGEPDIPAAQDQGEVQELRELLVIAGSVLKNSGYPKIAARIDAALAASTGQEE